MVAYGTEKPKTYPRASSTSACRGCSPPSAYGETPWKEGLGGGLGGLHDYRADSGGPGVAVDAENGRIL